MIEEQRRREVVKKLALLTEKASEGATLEEIKMGIHECMMVLDGRAIPEPFVERWAEAILQAAEGVTGIPRYVFMSPSRKIENTEVRYICYTILKEYGNVSFSRVGELFGTHQDHSTIYHAIQNCKDWATMDREFGRMYSEIEGRAKRVMQLFSTKTGL